MWDKAWVFVNDSSRRAGSIRSADLHNIRVEGPVTTLVNLSSPEIGMQDLGRPKDF